MYNMWVPTALCTPEELKKTIQLPWWSTTEIWRNLAGHMATMALNAKNATEKPRFASLALILDEVLFDQRQRLHSNIPQLQNPWYGHRIRNVVPQQTPDVRNTRKSSLHPNIATLIITYTVIMLQHVSVNSRLDKCKDTHGLQKKFIA